MSVSGSWTHGRVEMDMIMLDSNRFLRDHLDPVAGSAAALRPATVGRVHLCVGDAESARRFHVDQLGFESTAELGNTALYVSAGGYHRQMAMNTWPSNGADRRHLTLGLELVRIEVPALDDLGALADRLSFHPPWPHWMTAVRSPSPTPGTTAPRSAPPPDPADAPFRCLTPRCNGGVVE